MKTVFVGGGNMAQAIIGGLLGKGRDPATIHAIEPTEEVRTRLTRLGVSSAPAPRPEDLAADIFVLAVKPQMMATAIVPFAGKLTSALVISIAAGIRCEDLSRWLGGGKSNTPYGYIVRAMPNTPALIHAGISGLYAMPNVTPTQRLQTESLLGAVGETAWFDNEAMLDAVTAVSGSGPAYVFYFIEALEQAAKDLGFTDVTARKFAVQTFLGGAKLAADSLESPAALRERVTSKRGTTERAIESFDHQQLKRHFIEGVKTARARSHELGLEMSGQSTNRDAEKSP